MSETSTTASTSELQAVLDDLAAVLSRIPASAADHPTPCAEYSVAELRQHTVGWLTAFTDGFSSPDGECSDAEAVVVDGDGADQVRRCAQRLAEVLPAAAERPLVIAGSGMPASMALAMMLWEYQVHGWDLARSTGQPWAPDEGGLAGSLAFAPMMLTPDYQGVGKMFGPPVAVADDAPALDRLLGMSGRDPHWTASA